MFGSESSPILQLRLQYLAMIFHALDVTLRLYSRLLLVGIDVFVSEDGSVGRHDGCFVYVL